MKDTFYQTDDYTKQYIIEKRLKNTGTRNKVPFFIQKINYEKEVSGLKILFLLMFIVIVFSLIYVGK